jgi:hypothetical protein
LKIGLRMDKKKTVLRSWSRKGRIIFLAGAGAASKCIDVSQYTVYSTV